MFKAFLFLLPILTNTRAAADAKSAIRRSKSGATTAITTIASNAHSAATLEGGRAANGGNYVRA